MLLVFLDYNHPKGSLIHYIIQAQLAKDAKKELEDTLRQLGVNKGPKTKFIGRSERKMMWNNVKGLRTE